MADRKMGKRGHFSVINLSVINLSVINLSVINLSVQNRGRKMEGGKRTASAALLASIGGIERLAVRVGLPRE